MPNATMAATRRSSAARSARGGSARGAAASAPSARGASRVPTEAKLVFAVAGIFFAFSAFAVLQEDVYRTSYEGERFSATFLVLIVERGVNTAVGALGVLWLRTRGTNRSTSAKGKHGMKVPVLEIATSGVSQMLAMASANEALRFVSFPTQVLGKSCKMIPVMIGGIVAGRKFPKTQYAQVAAVTFGVVVFNWGKKSSGAAYASSSEKADGAYGLSLIVVSLVFDFVTAALQDRVKKVTRKVNPKLKNPKTSMFESMAWTNLGGFFVAFAFAAVTNQLADGVAFCTRHSSVSRKIGYYALTSVVGQLFVYFTITEFDPLVLSTVTTTRKIFSTAYSALRSPGAALTEMQWGGCACVFAALAWETLEKYRRAQVGKRIDMGGKAKKY